MTIINRQSWYFEPEGNKARLDILGTAEELPTGDVVTIKDVTYHLLDGSCFKAVDANVMYILYSGAWYAQMAATEEGMYNWAVRNYISGTGKVVIPDGVTEIKANEFKDCKDITEIVIPNSVKSIGGSAFSGCVGLTIITINKPEGSIEGAPWGATNATVVWNG